MSHPYKELFWKINKMRRARGESELTWLQFLKKEEARPKPPPAPPQEEYKRPPAQYDNENVRAKYGL